MTQSRELGLFALVLGILVASFFGESLLGGKVLSSADVLLAEASFREVAPANFEPQNRLLMDPALQFEPWIEFNRRLLRSGRLPLWNSASGCGAPHLANGQAAVFDPFLLIAYLGSVPEAYGWMAAARLWFAGMGMFLCARAWGQGRWGRWFTGLTFPFCGFLVAWLLYPVTNAAIWLPWTLLGTEAVWQRPSWRRASGLALTVAGTLLGGHVQTAAHVLLAAGSYAVWLTFRDRRVGRRVVCWGIGVSLGISMAAIEVVPLAAYLTRSPVWGDRDQERPAPWQLARPPAPGGGLHRISVDLWEPAARRAESGPGHWCGQPERGGGRLRWASNLDPAGPPWPGRPTARDLGSGSSLGSFCSGPLRRFACHRSTTSSG